MFQMFKKEQPSVINSSTEQQKKRFVSHLVLWSNITLTSKLERYVIKKRERKKVIGQCFSWKSQTILSKVWASGFSDIEWWYVMDKLDWLQEFKFCVIFLKSNKCVHLINKEKKLHNHLNKCRKIICTTQHTFMIKRAVSKPGMERNFPNLIKQELCDTHPT